METVTYPANILKGTKPCFICGATVKVPALYKDSYPAICSECYNAILLAKEKKKEEDNG